MNESNYINNDYLLIDELLSEEHKLIRNSVRQWVNKNLDPIIEEYYEKSTFPEHILQGLSEIGAFGTFIPTKYGGGGLDYISYGIIMQELERCDSGIRSTASVQSSLVMFPIYEFGTEKQKEKFLPKLAKAELIGAFGLTEPNHGSDPGGMESNFIDKGDHVLLNGSKMWISNSPICDIAIVWAKNEENRIKGLIVERGMKGFTTPETHGKLSLRASSTGELVFDNVKIPKENILEKSSGLSSPLACLDSARFGIAWGTIGCALDCYNTALKYSQERIQFKKPIASFQLQQKKLAEMITEITKAQLLALRVGQLKNKNIASSSQISMAKRNNVEMAIKIARKSRQILGGMGITSEYPIMRHMMNLESVITYEGTHDIHLLITGKDITGISAF